MKNPVNSYVSRSTDCDFTVLPSNGSPTTYLSPIRSRTAMKWPVFPEPGNRTPAIAGNGHGVFASGWKTKCTLTPRLRNVRARYQFSVPLPDVKDSLAICCSVACLPSRRNNVAAHAGPHERDRSFSPNSVLRPATSFRCPLFSTHSFDPFVSLI